jgi:uncharacterized protein (DUF2062 family)
MAEKHPESNVRSSSFRPAVVAPTYNNARTLRDVLARLDAIGLPVFVVNDGCTDETDEILAVWERAKSHYHVLTHPRNRGKAAALQTGFAAAADAGFSHCVTIDTDGQLQPADIPKLLDAAQDRPHALVLGVRDQTAADYPFGSRVGRRISNLMIWLECGMRVADSQCGLRIYPLDLVREVRCRAGHYGFETEIITRAAWAGFDVIGVPVSCVYPTARERVSHFKPWRDTWRAIRMHAMLVLRAMTPWPFETLATPDAERARASALRRGGGWRGFLDWINPARAWREVRKDNVGRTEFAVGLALGVFIGNLPAYGLHTLLSLYTARRLHLHPLAVVFGSHVSTPPLGPLLVTVALTVGHMLMHGGALPAPADFDVINRGVSSTLGPRLLEWAVGGLILGVAMAAVTFAATLLVLRATFSSAARPAGDAE